MSDSIPEVEDVEIEIHGSNSEVLFGCPVSYSMGQTVIHPSRSHWLQVATNLLNDGYNMCVDLTAVDYLSNDTRELPEGIVLERFEVVASFVSHERAERLRARVQISGSDPTIDSLYEIYPGTDFLEREVYDMFGITFEGHPDLSRILMPEEWQGHPLRKDFDVGAIPVQFKYPQGEKYD